MGGSPSELVLGKYEVKQRVAVGGMAEVFLATQKSVPGFERPAILKRLLPELAEQEGFSEQFLDEARVAAQLNHPNVVALYDVGEWHGTYYLAMEYIRGVNLTQLQKRAKAAGVKLPALVCGRIIHDAAAGLDHAHHAKDVNGVALQLVHRDVNPRNLMVRSDGVTKVVDFGIARATNRLTRTFSGHFKGTFGYLAPEQVLDAAVTAKTDQFALGIVFWELLTGEVLYKVENSAASLTRMFDLVVRPPSEVNPAVPAALDEVVLKMLHREPDHRYEDCGAAAKAIERVLAPKSAWGSGTSPVADFIHAIGIDEAQLSANVPSSRPAYAAEPLHPSGRELPPPPPTEEEPLVPLLTATPVPPSIPPASSPSRPPSIPPVVDLPPIRSSPSRPPQPSATPPLAMPPLQLPPLQLPPLQSGHTPPPIARTPSRPQATYRRQPDSADGSLLKVALLTVVFVVVVIGGFALLKPKRGGNQPTSTTTLVLMADAGPDAGVVLAVAPRATPRPPPDAGATLEGAVVERSKEVGVYSLVTEPPGARVELDGRPLGVSPQQVQLHAGPPHLASAELEGYERADVQVWPRAGEVRTVTLVLGTRDAAVAAPPDTERASTSQLIIVASPQGSIVTVDGKEVGNAPMTVGVEPEVPHEVTLMYAGYLAHAQTVKLTKGQRLTLEVALTPIGR